jgi:predicted transcriptional regulator
LEPEAENRKVKENGEWQRPRLDVSDAIEEAARMVDRFNRMVLRTLRALRDLRRYTPNVIVQNAGQVNVAEQQVNVVAEGRQSASL